jgi:hypothetical protein
MTRPETALAQLAMTAQTAMQAATYDGKGRAYYPAPGDISVYPSLLLFWGETSITPSTGQEQHWMIQPRGQLLVSQRGKLASDIARADPLIVPLVDAFAPGTDGFHLTDSEHRYLVDFCQVERVVPSLIIEFPSGSGVLHYGIELFWRIKLRRFTGGS